MPVVSSTSSGWYGAEMLDQADHERAHPTVVPSASVTVGLALERGRVAAGMRFAPAGLDDLTRCREVEELVVTAVRVEVAGAQVPPGIGAHQQ